MQKTISIRHALARSAALLLALGFALGATAQETTPFRITPGLNDTWSMPCSPPQCPFGTASQGFLFTVLPDSALPGQEQPGLFFLAWFTFDTERPDESVEAVLGEPGHRWLTAIGTWEGNVVTAAVEKTFGLTFNQPLSEDELPQYQDYEYGTITIEFEDCQNATLAYDLPEPDLQGEMPLIRVSNANVPLCETLAAAN